MNILEAMRTRRSVRTFDGKNLTTDEIAELQNDCNNIYNPFGGEYSIRMKHFDKAADFQPSTYGMIKNAMDYFTIGTADNEISALATGFCFEQVVLRSWQRGLGTCWIAATFKGSDFDNGIPWPEGQKLRIVSPVGRPAGKSLLENISRFTLGSSKRKPFKELFFTDNFNRSLTQDNRYTEALEMLRYAPSSTNSQPWRVLVEGDKIHFYYVPKSALSVMDTGIGICHFYETEHFYGREGRFYKEPEIPSRHDKWRYLISYIPDTE
ncbi:MAG: hypothetical protein K2H86_03200 [Muribaculaceae bacterium]|nr:hypothetical protein [Muribaculaceae bacterium]